MRFDNSIKEDFLRLANNNEQAWSFVELFANWSHQIDDLIDQDKTISDEEVVEMQLAWMAALSTNPFYLANQSFLMPLLILSSNTWLDSNKWGKSEDPVQRCHSDVLKSQYHEVIFACVYLCGGWKSLREFTALHREYQKDNYGNVCT